MSGTIDAALIASAATLIGTLGTQALNNRREEKRRRAEVTAARNDEVRALLEEAALTIRQALDLLIQQPVIADPGLLAEDPLAADVRRIRSDLNRIRTRISVRVPILDQQASEWRLVFGCFDKASRSLHAAIQQGERRRNQPLTEQDVRAFERSLNDVRTSLGAFTTVTATAFGATAPYYWSRRERLEMKLSQLPTGSWWVRRLTRRRRPDAQ